MTISKYIHPNGTEIPLEKVCEKCNGIGKDKNNFAYINHGGITTDCHICNGTGKTWIYYQPYQIKKLTGKDLSEDTAVWSIPLSGSRPIELMPIDLFEKTSNLADLLGDYLISIVAFPYQPKPPKDWRKN